MDKAEALTRLRAHEAELRAMGVTALSLFGSVARGEAGPDSDVDVAVTLDRDRHLDLLDFATLNLRLQDMLGVKVDLISEPARRVRFQAQIDLDRAHAF